MTYISESKFPPPTWPNQKIDWDLFRSDMTRRFEGFDEKFKNLFPDNFTDSGSKQDIEIQNLKEEIETLKARDLEILSLLRSMADQIVDLTDKVSDLSKSN